MADDYTTYLALLAECYPELAVRSWRPVQQGWDSLTMLVNDALIFRFARRPDVAVRLGREARLLPGLAGALPVAIPRVAYVAYVGGDHNETDGVRIVGYPALPGQPLTAGALAALDATKRDQLAAQLGAFLSALHAYPVAVALAAGVPVGSVAAWRQEYADFYAEIREHVFPLLSAPEQRAVASLWEGYLYTPTHFAFTPTLIHRDLGVEHILHNAASGALTGVIDWGDAGIGDHALDVTGIARSLGHEFAARVLAHDTHPIDATFWDRVAFYSRIIPFHEIRFGHYERDAAHIAAGLAALREQLRGAL